MLVKVVDALIARASNGLEKHARSDDGGRGARLKQPGPRAVPAADTVTEPHLPATRARCED
jgi:hypothetical protein